MEIPDLFQVLNIISNIREILRSTREIDLVFLSSHEFFCLLYKLQVFHQYKMSRSYDW